MSRAASALFVALTLTACNQRRDQDIPPVPAQTDESARKLMSEAEQAARNAQQRASAVQPQQEGNRQ